MLSQHLLDLMTEVLRRRCGGRRSPGRPRVLKGADFGRELLDRSVDSSAVSIVDSFDTDVVELLASPPSISRGRAYAADGRVTITTFSDTELQADVRGTTRYRVRLWTEGGAHRWRCDCPVGLNGEFCKHSVAALASAAAPEARPAATSVGDPDPREPDELARFLASLPPEQLASLVLEQAEIDHQFRTRLSRLAQLQNAAPASGTDTPAAALDLRALKKEITAAYGRGYVSYREAAGWAARVFEAIEWISDINDAGHFRTAALLAQHAHKRAESAMNRVDDSGGEITEISNRLAEIHAAACVEGAFPSADLARRLIKLELDAELDTFHRSAVSHREALGPEGLAVYGRLAQEAYDALPTDSHPYGKAFRVRQARIAHALATNDPDQLVDVLSDEVRSPADHLEIIDAFQAAGRIDEALAWADTSLSVFAERHHQLVSVRARRADLLRQLGDDQAIVDMYRQSFEATPTPETYRLFVEAAPDPDRTRRDAIDHVLSLLPTIGDQDDEAAAPTIGRPVTDVAANGVVAVLLAAGDDDLAWSVALEHGATDHEWLKMAEHRQISDPESAIAVLTLETERAIERKNRSGYRQAAQLLERIERLATKANKPELHRQLTDQIHARHHRKSSLMELLRTGN